MHVNAITGLVPHFFHHVPSGFMCLVDDQVFFNVSEGMWRDLCATGPVICSVFVPWTWLVYMTIDLTNGYYLKREIVLYEYKKGARA